MIQAPNHSQQPALDGSRRHRGHLIFAAAGAVLLVLAAAIRMLLPRLPSHKPRIVYGAEHLPAALCICAVLCGVAALCLPLLRRRAESLTTQSALASLFGVATLLWLPIVHASRAVADDWLLLAAATVRHSLAVKPWLAWYALDTVDGNFRPFGTVVYLNHGFSVFGFYAGFLCCTLAAMLLYLIARRIGAQPKLALCAALLFISRDLLYGPVAWLSALGDSLVIVFGAACILLLLQSLDSKLGRAVLCHAGAFACLMAALLSKQSAYCLPLLTLLTLVLRPGQAKPARTVRQWSVALLIASVYLAACIAIFFHARALSGGGTPYPVSFTMDGFGYLLRSVLWYFAPLELFHAPGVALVTTFGAVLLVLLAAAAWRCRSRLGLGEREFVFCLLAAFVSIALFLFLPTRRTPYYGDFAAFWISLPVAALLLDSKLREGARGLTLIVALVVLGGIFIQIKRTALIPNGVYLAGTYQMDEQAAGFAEVREALRQHPGNETVVIRDDSVESYYPAMICTLPSDVRTIYVFNPKSNQWLVNALGGQVPQDTRDSWTDRDVFHWTRVLPSAPALMDGDKVVTISVP